MKALHTFYQFGKEIIGGAEYYSYMLSKELVQKGAEVDILTTKSDRVMPNSPYGISWKNNFKNNYESYGGLNIYRCSSIPLPRIIGLGLSFFIHKQMIKEHESVHEGGNQSYLSDGWHYLQKLDEDESVRWTKKYATFNLNDKNISKIGLEVYCPKKINGSIFINDASFGKISLQPDKWTPLEYYLDSADNELSCQIRLNNTWKPHADNRRLGILVRKISYTAENTEKLLSLENDYDYHIRCMSDDFLFKSYMKRALSRPHIYDYLSMVAKGPISPKLIHNLKESAKKSDVLMGNMVPFSTINYITWAGKKTGTPTVLLPFFHIRDLNHYWRYFFNAFRDADIVLASSAYSKEMIFDRLGIRSEFIGAGIDVEELNSAEISGNRFRKKYGLEGTSLVLFVARKTFYKRYDMAIEAVQILNKKGLDVKLIMVGPDEDKVPIRSENVIYLGRIDRDELLDAYDACDVFSMQSEYESFGIVFCEAWMRGKPVIGNAKCGPVSSLIDNQVDGFLCNDSNELSEQISMLLDDPALAKKMGACGRSKVLNNYTWDIIASKVLDVYEHLLEDV